MLAELEPIWTAYATVSGDHSGWQDAAVYLRESKREQVEGYSPAAQLKGTLEEARRLHQDYALDDDSRRAVPG